MEILAFIASEFEDAQGRWNVVRRVTVAWAQIWGQSDTRAERYEFSPISAQSCQNATKIQHCS